MHRNFHYILSATPANPKVNIKKYVHYFPTLISNYNQHVVSLNPKEIDHITLSKVKKNTIVFDFWSEKKLPVGRELQSLRRVSEDLAAYDSTVIIRKSHVFVSN